MHQKLYSILLLTLISCASFANNRLIIKYKPTITQTNLVATGKMSQNSLTKQLMTPLSSSQMNTISKQANIQIEQLHSIATGAHVLRLSNSVDSTKLQQIINHIKLDKNVEYVVEDRILKANINTINSAQWDMQESNTLLSPPTTWLGDNFTGAWNILFESTILPGNGVIVAVIDTGYTPHPNFLSNLQLTPVNSIESSYGYQFISDCRKAGSCPSSTASGAATLLPQQNGLDLGDYLTQQDINQSNGFFTNANCNVTASSWHGTHVTGTIIGQGYSSITSTGILGGAYGAKVLPIRVLGKCGGYSSDIINGMFWAAGFEVANANTNTTPAKIISMSLGGEGACDPSQQDAINQITQTGVIIVVAAGNSTKNMSGFNPASCNNVISVAANGPTESLAYYSNYGSTTITAAGGDSNYGVAGCTYCGTQGTTGGILSTLWTSLTVESIGQPTYAYYQGTSMATPHVAAAVADIIEILNTKGESATTYNITKILQATAQYSTTNCNTGRCVTSGNLNVESAIIYAQNNTVPPNPPIVINPTSSGGGGCSMLQNGSDYSIYILLFTILLIGALRYLQIRRIKKQ